MPQKLMVLGAGPFQIGVIEKARALGAETIALSNNPDDPGMSLADRCYECSTIDLEAVLEIARHERIDGVMTAASEVGAVTAGYVAEQMQLEGYSYRAAETIANKYLLRDFLRKHGLPQPRFGGASNVAEALEVFRSLTAPVVVKPVAASGSRGVSMVSSEAELSDFVNEALRSSILASEVILEEFLPGLEIGGEVIVGDGRIQFLTATKKYLNEYHVPFGHLLPPQLDQAIEQKINRDLAKAVDALDLKNGPLNFDIMIHDGEPTIIELGGRLGGNCLPDLMHYHTGTDTTSLAVGLALGRELPAQFDNRRRPVAAYIVGAQRQGRVKAIVPFEKVAPPGTRLIRSYMPVQPGHEVYPFTQGNLQLGFHIIAGESPADLLNAMDTLHDVNWIEYH